MTFAANFLGGAKDRLLPPFIPFRFFAAAAFFHVLLWAFLLLAAERPTNFTGGLGPSLAIVHLLTLGVLTTTAIGASVQILPVATRRLPTALWRTNMVFWFTVPGIVILVAGMYTTKTLLLSAGACVTSSGLALFAWLMANHLRNAGSLRIVAAYGWAALASLVGALGLGIWLAFNYSSEFIQDPQAIALAHLILGGFGFMGLLVVGFSHILIPMFALAPVPAERKSLAIFVAVIVAIVFGTCGALVDSRVILTLAAVIGLAAAGGYLWLMHHALEIGLRKNLGLSFVLVRGAMIILPVTILAGLNALYGVAGHNRATLFGFLLLFGWMLTFLLGILQRILPFLASMFLKLPARGGPSIVSALSGTSSLRIHAGCHLLALIVIGGGIATDSAEIVRLGSAIGLIGAIAFAWFTGVIVRQLLLRQRS